MTSSKIDLSIGASRMHSSMERRAQAGKTQVLSRNIGKEMLVLQELPEMHQNPREGQEATPTPKLKAAKEEFRSTRENGKASTSTMRWRLETSPLSKPRAS